MKQRYFKSKTDAKKAAAYYNEKEYCNIPNTLYEVFKQPKGTRHHGQYYVGSYMEWLNYAN